MIVIVYYGCTCFILFIIWLILSMIWYSFPLGFGLLALIGKIFIHSDSDEDTGKQIVCGLVVVIIIGLVINYWELLSDWFRTIFSMIGNH